MRGFIQFMRQHGIIGLAIGFILGSSISRVITSLVNDIVNPVLGFVLGSTKGLEKQVLQLGTVKILYGHFVSVLVDFLIVALVVYGIVKLFRIDKIHTKVDL